MPVVRQDPHPQTRQYAIRALKAYDATARDCLHDLCDLAQNPAEKDYLRRDAKAAVIFIEETVRIATAAAEHHCQRCHKPVSAERCQIPPDRRVPDPAGLLLA